MEKVFYFTKKVRNIIFKKIKLTKFEDDQMKGIISSFDVKYIINLNLSELNVLNLVNILQKITYATKDIYCNFSTENYFESELQIVC